MDLPYPYNHHPVSALVKLSHSVQRATQRRQAAAPLRIAATIASVREALFFNTTIPLMTQREYV